MKLYCIRHGQTDYNLAKRNQGSEIDTELNETGKQQVRDLIPFLPLHIDAIISSPMKRTAQTAEIVAEHYNLPIHYNPLLVELSYGTLADKTLDECIAITHDPEFESKDVSARYNYHAYGGESAIDVQRRIQRFISEIKSHYNESNRLIIVTHGGIIESLEALLETPVHEAGNAKIYEFEI